MGAEIIVDGVAYAEVRSVVVVRSVAAPVARVVDRNIGWVEQDIDFRLRLSNWRRVVMGPNTASAGVCAAWARWYLTLRTSEASPNTDVLDARHQPVRPLVAADVMDGWLVEAAYRQLSDFNDRMALKCRHIYGFDDVRTRTKLKGVRGPHVRLVIARAENKLFSILKKLEARNMIRPTTCPPGCPEPTAATGASLMEA